MKKIYWFVIVLISIVVILFIWISGSPSSAPGYTPRKGDFFDIHAGSVYDLKHPETTAVNGVEITLEDMTGNQPTQTDTTRTISYSEDPEDNENGSAYFKIIVGNTYKITASFNDSTNSTICTFGPTIDEEGHHWFIGDISIVVSKENTIGPIICSSIGFL